MRSSTKVQIGSVVVFVLLFTGGCSPWNSTRSAYHVATVTWDGFDGVGLRDPEQAMYRCNGWKVGKGQAGYSQILTHAASLPRGAVVIIGPDLSALDMKAMVGTGSTIVHPNTVPFRDNGDLFLAFSTIARDRGLTLCFITGSPHPLILWDDERSVTVLPLDEVGQNRADSGK
jgi:hypothetical protein